MSWTRWMRSLQINTSPKGLHRKTKRGRTRQAVARPSLVVLEDRTLFAAQVLSFAGALGSTPISGSTANLQSEISPEHSVSDNGQYTVFMSTSTNLVAGQTQNGATATENIYLFNTTNQSLTLISHDAANLTLEGNDNSFNAVISGDGSTVAFYSSATDLIAGDTVTAGTVQLYLYSVQSGTLTLVTHTATSLTTGGNASEPSLPPSVPGTYVNTLAYSVGNLDGLGVGAGLALPSLSSNGQYVAYISDATNLGATIPSNTLGVTTTNVFTYDNNPAEALVGGGVPTFGTNTEGASTLVSHGTSSDTTAPTQIFGTAWYATTASISADGTTVAFTDSAEGLVPGATTDGLNDQLYVWSRVTNSTTGLSAGEIVLASHEAGSNLTGGTIVLSGLQSLIGVGYSEDSPPSLSANGTVVAYNDQANNLVPSQTGTASVLNVFSYNVVSNTNTLVTFVPGSPDEAGNNPPNQVDTGGIGPAEASGPQSSADGTLIVYPNNSSNLITGMSNPDGYDNVYLYSSVTGQNTLISHAAGSTTTMDTYGGTAPSMSSDGRYITFMDEAVPAVGSLTGNIPAPADILLYDSQASPTAQPTTVGVAFDLNLSTPIAITGASWSSKIATITANNNYTSGETVTVAGIGGATGYNGTFTIKSATATSFTYSLKTQPTGTPTFTGATAVLPTTMTDFAGSLAPTVMNANSADGPVVAWDGLAVATDNVPGMTDTNTNFDVFETIPSPQIVSSGSGTFLYGSQGTYTFGTIGFSSPPTYTLVSGTLPTGLSLTSTGIITGIPTQSGQFGLIVTATGGGVTSPPFGLTLTVNQTPTFTSPSSTTFLYGTPGSFTVLVTTYPTQQTLTESGTLPPGASFNSQTGVLTSTSQTPTGTWHLIFTSTNSIGLTNTQNFTLIVGQPPAITSPSTTTFTTGTLTPFTVTTTGYPTDTLSESGPLPNSVTFTDNGNGTATLTGIPAAGTAGSYPITITASNGVGTPYTQQFTLVVDSAPIITTQPTSQTVSPGQTATFTAAASGTPTPTVQWLISTDGGITFNDIPGATSTTYVTPATTTSDNGEQFEAVFINAVGSATTNIATLTVNQLPVITQQPGNQTVNAGQTGTFTAAASSNPAATVQWQISTNGGATFSNIPGATSTTYVTPVTAASDNGDEFQAIFTNAAGSVTTNIATLTVQYVTITTQPGSTTTNAGQTATFTAAASSNPTATVQWQISTDGGATFSNIPGATSTTYVTPVTTGSDNNEQFQAIFTNAAGSVTTNIATLTVQYVTITTQPGSTTVNAGQTATFTTAASSNPTATVQWQISTDGGTTFSNIPGGTSTTYTTPVMGAGDNGDEFQAIFTNAAGSVATNIATLTVQYLTITTQPGSTTVNAGQTATFTAAASSNPTATVQWQISTDGGATFSSIPGATSVSYTTPVSAASDNGEEFQAIFTNTAGSVTTNPATLTVQYVTITTQPGSTTINAGQTATFTAAASSNPAATVQWQMSTNGGTTFSNIPGATSTTYVTPVTTGSDNNEQFQAIFTNAAGSVTTNIATLTVQYLTITSQPGSTAVNSGQTATFTAAASSNPTATVQWQISTDGGTTFSNIPGATSTTYVTPVAVATDNGEEFQAVFTNAVGSATTNPATLTVQYLTITTQPGSTTVNAGQTATFTAAASANPVATVQWQISTNNGQSFSNIPGAHQRQLHDACRDGQRQR